MDFRISQFSSEMSLWMNDESSCNTRFSSAPPITRLISPSFSILSDNTWRILTALTSWDPYPKGFVNFDNGNGCF